MTALREVLELLTDIHCNISARLDGTGEKVRSRLAQHTTNEDWLELGEETNRPLKLGQKRVSKLCLYVVQGGARFGNFEIFSKHLYLDFAVIAQFEGVVPLSLEIFLQYNQY